MNTVSQTTLESFPDSSKQKSCSQCGVSFGCGPKSAEQGCWCEALPHVGVVTTADQDCLCPDCLTNAIAKLTPTAANTPPLTELVEGEDYYCEGAAIIFTAAYHLRRGYCCDSGCRHCPYELDRPQQA